jgi:hypothetical protein
VASDLTNSILDKIVISVLATAVSTAAFFNFNAYNKAFESAHDRSRAVSQIAYKLRDSVVEKTTALQNEIEAARSDGNQVLSADVLRKARTTATEIEIHATLSSGSLTEASKAASSIAKQVREDALWFSQQGFTDNERFGAFRKNIREFQTSFVVAFQKEIGGLAASEFRRFLDSYHSEIPYQARPEILAAAAGIIIVIILVILHFRREPSKGETDNPKESIGRGTSSSGKAQHKQRKQSGTLQA